MPYSTLWNDANTLWLVIALYFSVKYRHVQVKRTSAAAIVSLEHLCALFALALVFFPRTHLFVLATPFHASRSIAMAGFCITIAGLAFAAWARDVLGRNWSGRVVVQEHHQLVTAGPYAYVRHPLYTGLLIGVTGMTLISGDLGSLLGFLFALGFLALKAEREERILETEFGAIYANYRAHTGGLLPRIAHV